jgi:hypothetical protein
MYKVYYLGFYNNGGARVVVFPTFGKVRALSFTTFTATITTKDS